MPHETTILIVDDSPMSREMLEGILAPEGYALITAANGEQGLEKARRHRPDLILLDVLMPGMNGFEVCEELRKDPATAEAPVIFLTSLEDRESRLKGIKAGADDFLLKPFDAAELILRVRTITRLNRFKRINLQRERFQWVVEEAEDGHLVLDHSDTILYANPTARTMLGLSPQEAPDVPFLELARKRYNTEPAEIWKDWPALPFSPETKDSPGLPDLYLVRPETGGTPSVWLHVAVLEQAQPDEPIRILRLRDVSGKVNDVRDIWRFQSMITHKLRTPLGGLVFGMEALAEQVPEESRELARLSLESARRLRDELENVMDYLEPPMPGSGNSSFHVPRLEAVVADISKDLGIISHVFFGFPDANEAWIAIPRRSLDIVLWELLENAKKFHPTGAPTVKVVAAPAGEGRMSLLIADNGSSLTPQQLANVWSPYYQGEKRLTFEVQGMGLGLPRVATIIWNTGGDYRLANRDNGQGVIVELTLPLDEPHSGEGPAEPEEQQDDNGFELF